jgi:hypothetical protein
MTWAISPITVGQWAERNGTQSTLQPGAEQRPAAKAQSILMSLSGIAMLSG